MRDKNLRWFFTDDTRLYLWLEAEPAGLLPSQHRCKPVPGIDIVANLLGRMGAARVVNQAAESVLELLLKLVEHDVGGQNLRHTRVGLAALHDGSHELAVL